MKEADLARFWVKVDKISNDCWEWLASLDVYGYGQFGLNGTMVKAHRLAYELLRGPIFFGLVSDHLCFNRSCVNPWHLEMVTADENYRRVRTRRNQNTNKTHCKNNHPLSGDNLRIVGKRKERRCAICQAAYQAEWRSNRVGSH